MGHRLDGIVGAYRDRVFFHDVLYLRGRRVGNHLFQREYAAQLVVVVDHIHIVYFVHVFGLAAHLFYALGHTPILVYDDHFGTHETTGRVLVIFQQVDDVSGLFHVVDVGKHLFLCIFVEVAYEVYRIIGFEVVDVFLGDGFARHLFEELSSVVFVKFHQHVGGGFLVEQFVKELRLFDVEILVQFGNIGRVQVFEYFFGLPGIVLGNDIAYVFDVFFGKFFHDGRVIVREEWFRCLV